MTTLSMTVRDFYTISHRSIPLKTPTITNFPQALHHQEVSYQIYVADDGTTHETESHEDGSLAVVEGTVHIVQDTIIHGDVSFYA